ncbi:MAG: rhomboid family intramembrane serine protease [Planctomycetota bacterium]|nr:rhomboid family intramembrane serine protease [Planctomycetota bacterium]MEC9049085.1 rhomboid family intramembrane serine protease [Planctomycetota bacterium]
MIPLRDSIPASRPPVVRNALIGVCTLAWLLQLTQTGDELVFRLGMIPARLLGSGEVELYAGRYYALPDAYVPEWMTLLTCTFLHGGWLHFLGNMLFLWIFGDNVEDRFGRLPFLIFYLGCGVVASAAHLAASADSPVPTIGASGAIAGVMGAYMFLYPRSRVLALVPLGFLLVDVVLPAPFFLGYWFVLQLVQGSVDAGHGGGVAWWAHIGGFVIGALVAGGLRVSERLRPAPQSIVLSGRRRARPPWRRGI